VKKILLTLSIMVLGGRVLSGSLLAQESPITPRAARVQISAGPEVPLVGGYLTVIRWTVNNPGGLPVHYGVVHYGTDPKNLNLTAKNPIRLNPTHSSTVFRVNLYDLPPNTTYYYTVESMDSRGRSDGVTSPIKTFTTQ
jgi:phosphodiesterase/alkaline phosphatase D-like protein